MKHNAGKKLMAFGLLLLAAALALAFYNIWDEQRAAGAATEVLAQVEPLDPVPPTDETAPTYVLHPDMEMPTQEINGRHYVGVVSIPVLGLELPVLSEWSSGNAKIAPCRYKGSAYSGDMIIAGHNYRSHFGSLKSLGVGETVLFTDADGNVFTYTVAAMEVLPGTAVEEMEAGEWDLTLFTCTYGGQTRLTLRCVQ